MMLSEGPHGPHDEIGWAPGQGRIVTAWFLAGFISFVAAIAIIVTTNRNRKGLKPIRQTLLPLTPKNKWPKSITKKTSILPS